MWRLFVGAIVLSVVVAGCAPRAVTVRSQRVTSGSPAASEDDVEVYFSPEGGAMGAIVNEIDQARRSVDVSAYLITAKRIVDALAAAHQRGVRVRIVLDRDHVGAGFSVAGYLGKTGLAVWRDGRHKEAHNKMMLIDG